MIQLKSPALYKKLQVQFCFCKVNLFAFCYIYATQHDMQASSQKSICGFPWLKVVAMRSTKKCFFCFIIFRVRAATGSLTFFSLQFSRQQNQTFAHGLKEGSGRWPVALIENAISKEYIWEKSRLMLRVPTISCNLG